MTESEMKRIERLRRNGNSYRRIAEITGLGLSTIKMHCTRNNIIPGSEESKRCLFCGKELDARKTGRNATFCSDACRLKNWRKATKEGNGPERICKGCGVTFRSYVPTRKYCTHACYVRARFGEVNNDLRP